MQNLVKNVQLRYVKKISKSLIGNSRSLGYKHTENTRKMMGIARSGKNHWNWKGGIRIKDPNVYMRKRYAEMNEEKKKMIIWQRNSRNRRKRAIIEELGSHTYLDWINLKQKYNNECLCCNKQEPYIKLTEDHIIPLSRGGSDLIDNIQPLCLTCNMKKHTKNTKYLLTKK